MKLKEYPQSFFNTLRLLSIPVSKLNDKTNTVPVIVSLTTIESRLNKVHITLRSVMNQTVKPEKIVLWITEADRNKIPETLQKLTGDLLEIRYTPRTSSHKKLLPSLELFPDKVIVTCDDDLIYESQWLEKLYATHVKYPKDIICNKARQIAIDENGKTLDYKFWKYTKQNNPKKNLAIGEGGILYPPGALNSQITDYDLALKLAPKNDDLWFKAMALLNNTTVRLSENPSTVFIPIPGTQKISLKKINVVKNFNVDQWNDLTEFFNLKLN
ncbi:glycosyltransferase family A protein [Flavobacterium wongokense]|uniref:glycosyltransferase family A protein n=1 Tax=Flavobacterium wongokense TaxID=2910674 RepID=UPI001F29D806|nr:glycosyltransferase family A protein [Flavobacterium sp. WG47]MCF6132565.1 glycosyltransferase family 2 protein [Flavobacterium sp. WG47]